MWNILALPLHMWNILVLPLHMGSGILVLPCLRTRAEGPTYAVANQSGDKVGEALAEEEALCVGLAARPAAGLEVAVEPHRKAEQQTWQHLWGGRRGGEGREVRTERERERLASADNG